MNPTQMVALAVGAYFLYEYFYGGAGADGDISTGDTQGSTGSSSQQSVKQQILALGDQPKNFWQWNYNYTQVTGNTTGGIDPHLLSKYQGWSTSQIENDAITYDEWAAGFAQLGGSGLGNVWGHDWYAARRGSGAVSSQRANVMESASKRFIV